MSMLILLHNTSHTMFVLNFKILVAVDAEKSLIKNFIGEKEKWTNEGNKNEHADFLLHNITSHTQCLYQISKFYVQ